MFGKPFTIWRSAIDFYDSDWYDFRHFEDVYSLDICDDMVLSALKNFNIAIEIKKNFSLAIFNYAYGKHINLKNEKRWVNNFNGEISLFLMENGRYLQAYFRDVNKDIENDNIEKIRTSRDEKYKNVSSGKSTSVMNDGKTEIATSDSQNVEKNEGDTLTVLNTTSTSTNYLANSTDEAYSRGTESQNTGSSVSKSFNENVATGLNDSANVGANEQEFESIKDGTLSPLDIAKRESEFNFIKWFEDLKKIIDSNLMVGGFDYA